MLLGICGLKGSGKDTIGDYFVNTHGFIKLRFADVLKDIVSIIFSWDRELLEGSTPESREYREIKDEWWSTKLDMEITPRIVLQKIGTDLFRDHFHKNIWRIIVERKIDTYLNEGKDIVITDCRFMNEINMIKKYKGDVLFVCRNTPEWFNLYRTGKIDRPSHIHESETEWVRYKFDYKIDNNNDVGTLYEKSEYIYNYIMDEWSRDT